MTLVDHLTELRFRLLVSISAICVGAIVGWTLFDRVIDLLTDPYCDYLRTVPRGVRATRDCALFYSGALEPLLIKLKLVAFLGLFFALPVVLYQLWAFIVPGLTKRERRMAIPFVLCSVILFVLGALVAYWTLPKALNFLLGFAGQQFAPLLTGDRFLSFVMLVALSFGLVAANRGVKTRGPYGLVRHPAYTGYLITYLGYVAEHPSLLNIALLCVGTAFQLVRIREEEHLLSRDSTYERYRQRVRYRLIPLVY